MDLIHSLSNLEIETTHSSSQEEVEEDGRNWVELPLDVMSLIFMKLGTIDILGNAQWVCTSWWKLSKQPHLFRSISMEKMWVPFIDDFPYVEKPSDFIYSLYHVGNRNKMSMVEVAREAVDRSCGKLEEISVRYFATDELLHYISQRSESLRCLRLVDCCKVTHDGLTQVCKQFPQLEELELTYCSIFSIDVFKTIGCLCPQLKSFRLNYSMDPRFCVLDKTALVIAETMVELRNLHLFGDTLSDVGLRAILHGCPHLQFIDLRQCFNVKFEGDLSQMCANIKLRLPHDSFHDYEYAILSFYYGDDDYYSEDDDYYYIDSEDDWYNNTDM